jgi:hypothetical protein
MKVKSIALIFMVVFAAVATSIVINLSSSQITEKNLGFTDSYNIVQIDEVHVGPNGIPIDCPGGPT